MPFFSEFEIDLDRVFALVTWRDLLGMQASIGTDPEPTPYTEMTARFGLTGQQQATGLRNLVRKTFDLHRDPQQEMASAVPEGSKN